MMSRRFAPSAVVPPAILVALTVLAPALWTATAQAVLVGPNLLVNAGAETAIGPEWSQPGPAPTGPPVRLQYNAPDTPPSPGNLVTGGSFDGGLYFIGGGAQPQPRTQQTIVMSAADVSAIDAGGVTSSLNAFIGGFSSQGDSLSVNAVWRNAANDAVLTQTLDPVTNVERMNRTGFLPRESIDAIPPGARSVVVTLTGTRLAGNDNDGWIDNISLQLLTGAPPALKKVFAAPTTPPDDPITLTITVDNTQTSTPQSGWTFIDDLATGLVVAPTPNRQTTCVNGSVTAPAGDESITGSGDVAASASCTISVDVVSPTLGATYTNGADNMTAIGLSEPTSPATLRIAFTPPTVTISSPTAGTFLAHGSTSKAGAFVCASESGTVASCTASVAPPGGGSATSLTSGGSVPTATAGTYTITATAVDGSGQITTATRTYVVAAAPTATITTPASGAIYTSGHGGAAAYSCASAASTITRCAATVKPPNGPTELLPDGSTIPTADSGTYTITLTADDELGQTKTATRTYVVAAGPVATTRPPGCDKLPAKLALARATFSRGARTIDILAPITTRASGRVKISLRAARKFTNITAPIDSARRRIRIVNSILRSQAELGTGIITMTYDGDADTRPQVVRLRAANNKANLAVVRPTISNGFLRASGTVTSRAKGIVRVQLQYVNSADGQTVTLVRRAAIDSLGRWSLNSELSPAIQAQLAARCGTVRSYTLFTGYAPRRIRGEMKSLQVNSLQVNSLQVFGPR